MKKKNRSNTIKISLKPSGPRIRTPDALLYRYGQFDRAFHLVRQTPEGCPDSAFLRRQRRRFAAYSKMLHAKLEKAISEKRAAAGDPTKDAPATDEHTSDSAAEGSVQPAPGQDGAQAPGRISASLLFEIIFMEKVIDELVFQAARDFSAQLESYAAGALQDRHADLAVDLCCSPASGTKE